MITKDEEKILEKCLNPIKGVVDEIIIVDTGSKDNTKEIAKKFTDNIYDFEWNDDFSKARNFSISKATKDWILVLDPDEKIEKDDLIQLKRTIEKQQLLEAGGGGWAGQIGVLGYRLIQQTYHNNEIISIRGICRLFKNDDKIRFTYPIHETVRESIKNLKARIGKTGIVIKHYPEINKEKQEYYLRLLKAKKQNFPESNIDKEIENEYNLFNPH
jgi:glycosyltransferase involved in cell wall biosynthesis